MPGLPSNERMIEMKLNMVASLENPDWRIKTNNRIIFARNDKDLYICSPDEYINGEGAKWHSNDLQEALEHYRQHHKNWRAWVYE